MIRQRLVHLGCEIVVKENGRAVERAGRWLITKLSKYAEQLFDLEFHKTFCRLHAEAQAQALRSSHMGLVSPTKFHALVLTSNHFSAPPQFQRAGGQSFTCD